VYILGVKWYQGDFKGTSLSKPKRWW